MRTSRAADRFVAHCSISLVIAFALAIVLASAGPAAAAAPDGKAVFLAQKCNLCHSVSSAGIEATIKAEKMRGPDLTGVVAAKGEDETIKFIKHEAAAKDGQKHKKEWKGTDDELKALVAWLAAQKKP